MAAHGQRHLLDGGEIVFGMRKAHAESDIRVSGTDDVRHAEGIALDAHAILPRLGDQAGRIRRRGLAQPVGHDQGDDGPEQYQRQRESADLHVAHACLLLWTEARIRVTHEY